MKLKLLCPLIFLMIHTARAHQPPDAWSARCELDQHPIVLKLASPSGDAAENLDMTMEIKNEIGTRVQVKIQPDWYFKIPSNAPIDDACDGLASRRIGESARMFSPCSLLEMVGRDSTI